MVNANLFYLLDEWFFFTLRLKTHTMFILILLLYFLTLSSMMGHCGCHRMCKAGLMLVFGVLFFLGTLGVWPEFSLMKYWPLVFIVLGLHGLACGCKDGCACESCKKK